MVSPWLSNIVKIFRFSNFAAFKGRKRTTSWGASWKHATSSSSSSYYFRDWSVNWEQLLLPFKIASTLQKNADTSRVLPLDQTWAVILHNRRKNSIWIVQKHAARLKSHQHTWSITGSVFKVPPTVQGFNLQDFLARDFPNVTQKAWDIIKPSLRDGKQSCLNCKTAFSSKFSPKCLVKQALKHDA